MFVYKIKNYVIAVLALVLSLCFCFGVRFCYACKLSALSGKRTFYLDYPSSQALRAPCLNIKDIFRVKGESVRFVLDDAREREAIGGEIVEKYDAEILFTEEACGTISFYCYAPALYAGVCVRGRTVNLHIAATEKTCAGGSPIIFDGF